MKWRAKNVLIAEDDEINFLVLSGFLEPTGIQVRRARNGREVVDLCRQETPDLILLDMKMPFMSGYEAVEKLREFNTETPVIAQTAYAMKEDREEAIARGCNDHIAKPIIESDLLEKMRQFLGD